MTAVDYIILAILVIGAVTGAMKGFLNQLGAIAGFILGILVARLFGGDVAAYLVPSGCEYESLYHMLVYVLLFIIVFLSVRLIAGMFSKALSAVNIRGIDRVAGAIFRVGVWLVVMSIAANLCFALSPDTRKVFAPSPSKPWRAAVTDTAPALMGYLATESKK